MLRGNDQASCERFVTPATLDLLLGLARHLDQPNLEFSSQERLCLSFDNAQVMAHADLGALSDLSVFRERIEEGLNYQDYSRFWSGCTSWRWHMIVRQRTPSSVS